MSSRPRTTIAAEDAEYFSNEDLRILLGGAHSVAAADEVFMTTFMTTFVDMVTGKAIPETSLAVPLQLSVVVACFDGIPLASTPKLPESIRKIPIYLGNCGDATLRFKFPIRGMITLVKDTEFNRKLAFYVFEGQKEAIVKAGDYKCNCCGSQARDLVAIPYIGLPRTDDMLQGFMILVDWAFPVCDKTGCLYRLRDYAWRVKQEKKHKGTKSWLRQLWWSR